MPYSHLLNASILPCNVDMYPLWKSFVKLKNIDRFFLEFDTASCGNLDIMVKLFIPLILCRKAYVPQLQLKC